MRKAKGDAPAKTGIGREVGASRVAQDYVKAIYRLGERGDRVTTKRLAEAMKVSAPTVTQTLRRLSDNGLVGYASYRGVTLTKSGERVALEMIRHHRLVEQFLFEVLGLPWDRVHDEAERWEHILSEEVEARIAAALGHPTRDPHGARIPSQSLILKQEALTTLAELEADATVVIAEVGDHDAALLRYLEGLGLVPDAEVTVKAREPFGGAIVVVVNGVERRVSPAAAAHIRVRRSG
jgi:DtxR family Mn-dependent transcriptional regulator